MVFCYYQGAVRFSVRTVLDCEQSLSLATVRRSIHECKKQDRTNYSMLPSFRPLKFVIALTSCLCTETFSFSYKRQFIYLPLICMEVGCLPQVLKKLCHFFAKLVSCPVSGQRVQFPAINREQKFHSIRLTKRTSKAISMWLSDCTLF